MVTKDKTLRRGIGRWESRRAMRLAGLAATTLALALGARAASAVVISAPVLTVTQGSGFEATVSVDELSAATTPGFDTIAGFDLLLGFDSARLRLDGVAFTNALDTPDGGAAVSVAEERSDGVWNLVAESLFGNEFVNQDGGAFDLFTVSFTALSEGVSELLLTPNTLGSNVFFTDPDGNTLPESAVNGEVTITAGPIFPVPAPTVASLAPLMLLVAGAVCARRRQHKRRSPASRATSS